MKLLSLFLAALVLLLPAYETAEHATSDAGDIAGHALAKTGSALQHGGEKLQNATE